MHSGWGNKAGCLPGRETAGKISWSVCSFYVFYIYDFVGGLTVILDGLIVIPVILQIRDIVGIDGRAAVGQVDDQGAGRSVYELVAITDGIIPGPAKIIVRIAGHLYGNAVFRQGGNDGPDRRRHHLIASVVGLIEYSIIILIIYVVDRDDHSAGEHSAEEKAERMPGRPVYIGLIGMIVIVMIRIETPAAPDVWSAGVCRPVGLPAGRTVMDRRAGGWRTACARRAGADGRATTARGATIIRWACITGRARVARGPGIDGRTCITRRADVAGWSGVGGWTGGRS